MKFIERKLVATINYLDNFSPIRTELELQFVRLSWLQYPSYVPAAKNTQQMQVAEKTEQEDLTGKAI